MQAEESEKRLQKEADDEAKRVAAREERAAAARDYQEAEWILNSEAPDSESEEDVADHVLHVCELCDKRFKSKAAFVNHRRCASSPKTSDLSTVPPTPTQSVCLSTGRDASQDGIT